MNQAARFRSAEIRAQLSKPSAYFRRVKMNQAATSTEESAATAQIRSRPCPNCLVCATRGELLYSGLTDCLFGAPGEWKLNRCPSPECGLIWLDPMPLEEDIGIAYESYFTHAITDDSQSPPSLGMLRRAAELSRSAYRAWRYNYGDGVGKPLRWLLAIPIRLARIDCEIPLRYLAVPEKGRMLDLGCGAGSVLKIARELGWNAEGVDFDAQAVDAARGKGLSVRLGRLADQRYADESFDLILMSHAIEHMHDPSGTFGEIHRLLRPGGTLAVITPNAGSWGHRHFGDDWRGLEPPRHLQIFTAKSLVALANRARFARSTVSSTLRIRPYVFMQSRITRRTRAGGSSEALLSDHAMGTSSALAEMFMRLWDPLAADELLLEARK
jgi:SAM-dependent methyltransferase